MAGLSEYAEMMAWNNMSPLDKKEQKEAAKGGGVDPVRGTVQIYLGHCSDMSLGRGNSAADLGTATPNPCSGNDLYQPKGEGTFRPLSRFSEVYNAPWADKDRILRDPVLKCKYERFVRSADLCPLQYDNVVPAITHARTKMFTLGGDQPAVEAPTVLTNDFWMDALREANYVVPDAKSVMDDDDYYLSLLGRKPYMEGGRISC
jgi:hypothetical protein